jgi:hypothetical protein
MAVSLTVVDSVNFPDNSKTVSVDLKSIVDSLSEGDERWFLTVTTNALSTGSTSIDDELVSYTLNGFSRSSGLASQPYVVTSGHNYLNISIDGSVTREIGISTGTYNGTSVSTALEEAIRALADTGELEAGNLSFKNSAVDFNNGKIEIKSGTISNTYVGTGRSSVVVTDGTTGTGLAALLGFDIPYESVSLAALAGTINTTKTSGTVSSGSSLSVVDGTGFSDGDAIVVRAANGNTQNFVISSGGGTTTFTVVPNVSVSLASGSKVQTLVEDDPDSVPTSPTSDVDSILTKAVASIVAQIDFSL